MCICFLVLSRMIKNKEALSEIMQDFKWLRGEWLTGDSPESRSRPRHSTVGLTGQLSSAATSILDLSAAVIESLHPAALWLHPAAVFFHPRGPSTILVRFCVRFCVFLSGFMQFFLQCMPPQKKKTKKKMKLNACTVTTWIKLKNGKQIDKDFLKYIFNKTLNFVNISYSIFVM